MNCIIFGNGRIGKELMIQANERGYKVVGVVTRSHLLDTASSGTELFGIRAHPENMLKTILPFCDQKQVALAFFAIPSGGNGAAECMLMRPFVMNGIPVITAGKSAMANRFGDLEAYEKLIGCDASVGGGTGFLPTLEQNIIYDEREPITIKGVFNGTMNYILSGRWGGRLVEAVLREAIVQGYAEPVPEGQKPNAHTIFLDEIEDVKKKVTITQVRALRRRMGRMIKLDEFKTVPLGEKDLDGYLAESARVKYVVEMSTEEFRPEIDENAPGSISLHTSGLNVVGGFCNVPADSALDRWLPDGVGNAFKIIQGGNEILVSGEGAGPKVTARRMILNAHRLAPQSQLKFDLASREAATA